MDSTMSMSTSMMSSMPTSTTSGMSMASSTSSSMSMSSSSGTMMGMEDMAMVFFTSTSTPLYSDTWTPNGVGQYAGTCIFLIAFAAIFRALLAMRMRIFDFVGPTKQSHFENARYAHPGDIPPRPRQWRAGEATSLAAMDVVIAGVSYLLMLAVMTMNVGYFLSILGGVFLGSMIFGHLTANSAAH